jgi:citrate lyase subunit beta/citryl-CoA lyase
VASQVHPAQALFGGELAVPMLAACEHYAGRERQMLKALELQAELGPVFDVTCDCEDGAPVGAEREHALMVAGVLTSQANRFRRAGVRIHDHDHPAWRQDLDIILSRAGDRIAYVTLPKVTSRAKAASMIETVQSLALRHGLRRDIPIHVLIETHGGLREVWEIAALPWIQTLDFGLLDFVSGHGGAIPASAMRSPGQFEHRLVVRAKAELAAAALANGLVPTHNVTAAIDDPDAAYQDARRAHAELGYLRMYSIHPAQIQPIVNAMKPDPVEVERAGEILVAAQQAGWGPIRHGTEMHDRASYRHFWRVLSAARATGVRLPPAAEAAFFNGVANPARS